MQSNKPQTSVKLRHYLETIGIPKLKKEQKQIIESLLNKKDVIGVLPTGFGKSVCYLLPQLILKKTVIVVSPLISLIEDQQKKYSHVTTILASYGNIANVTEPLKTSRTSEEIKKDIYKGSTPALIYMTPENFMKQKKNIMKMINSIGLIAIDECHCISTWSDFRDGYSNFYQVIEWFENCKRPPFLAVTGTATEKTIKKVAEVLDLQTPVHIQLPPTRKNLSLNVIEESNFIQTIRFIREHIQGQVIVYCKTRKDTEKISTALSSWGYTVGFYHAGLNSEKRTEIQNKFTQGKLQIICATIAFGMGIDISNIETVFHFGLPKNLESYCQEIGRAARGEGLNGKCFILWKKQDHYINRMFINNVNDPEIRSDEWEKNAFMKKFIENKNICRMKLIHEYFKKKDLLNNQFENCNKCDICNSHKQSKYFVHYK